MKVDDLCSPLGWDLPLSPETPGPQHGSDPEIFTNICPESLRWFCFFCSRKLRHHFLFHCYCYLGILPVQDGFLLTPVRAGIIPYLVQSRLRWDHFLVNPNNAFFLLFLRTHLERRCLLQSLCDADRLISRFWQMLEETEVLPKTRNAFHPLAVLTSSYPSAIVIHHVCPCTLKKWNYIVFGFI